MMNSEQEEELIRYLSNIGFNGEEFEAKLRDKIRTGEPNFKLDHVQSIEDESMSCSLQFRNDIQFGAYRLTGYKAALRNAPVLSHSITSGIDTEKLEQGFKQVDWALYFRDIDGTLTAAQQSEIKDLLNDFWKLNTVDQLAGKEMQELLQYKYWPEHAWSEGAKRQHDIFGSERSFNVSEYGICNTNLAFNILNDRLGNLEEDLMFIGLDDLPGSDVHRELERILSGNPDRFELRYVRNNPEGHVEITVPVTKEDGWYNLDTYTVSLTPYPPIEHGKYNGIDTAQLEGLMREVDWHRDGQLFILREDAEPEFRPKVVLVDEQINRLSMDRDGSEVAEKLRLKYWADASFFSDMLGQSAWDYFDTLPKMIQEFPSKVKAVCAINLLYGRAVIDYSTNLPPSAETNNWIRFDLENKDPSGNYPIKKIEGFSQKQLEELMSLLPITTADFYPIRNSLLRGDLIPVTFGNDKNVMVEANPEQKTLNLYTPDYRPIPFNFHFDPDWKPEETIPHKQLANARTTQNRTPKVRLNNRYKKGKGL